jgi:hypothetical protein
MSIKNKAAIIAVLGASGSGKSTFVKQYLASAKPKRLLVWDFMREYKMGSDVTRLSDLSERLQSGAGFSLTFRPSADESTRAAQFDVFCGLALAAKNLTLVVEELRFVTTPSRAPMRWAQVTMTGRHAGLRVIGTSQRPASIDKDFLGNATLIHTGRLVYPEDTRAVSKAMRVPESEIDALAPLDWLEKDMQSGKKAKGRITF